MFLFHNDPPRTRTWNLRLRRPTPYPLGQRAQWLLLAQPRQSRSLALLSSSGPRLGTVVYRSPSGGLRFWLPLWVLRPWFPVCVCACVCVLVLLFITLLRFLEMVPDGRLVSEIMVRIPELISHERPLLAIAS